MKKIGVYLIILFFLVFFLSFILWVNHYQDTLTVLLGSSNPIDIIYDGFNISDVNKAKDVLLELGYGKGIQNFIRDQTLINPYTVGMIVSFFALVLISVIIIYYERYIEKKKMNNIYEALKDNRVIEGDLILETVESIRKQYQSRLKHMALDHDSQNQELENLAHQMKSTLSTILLHIDQISSKGNEKHKNCIIDQVDRCNEMLNRFLKGYDVRSNLTNYHYEVKNVADSVRNVINHVTAVANHKGLTIQSNLENCTMAIDSFWIQEAIETILMNSIESAYSNSIIYVNMKKFSNELQISITNDGACPKDIHSMFTRYDSSQQKQGHFGIGLHMVQTVCKNHMGHIFASYEDKKMTIQIILPLYQLECIKYS